MGKTLDEWTESVEAAQRFKENLQTHLSVLVGTKVSPELKETIVRLVMISFRDAALDCGAPE